MAEAAAKIVDDDVAPGGSDAPPELTPQPTPQPGAPTPSDDDVGRWIDEFQTATAAKPQAAAAPSAAPGPTTGQATSDEIDRLLADWAAADAQYATTSPQLAAPDPKAQRIEQLEAIIRQAQYREWERGERAACDALVSGLKEDLRDLPLPENYAEAAWYRAGITDVKLRFA
jgi:hypothetical protein